MRILVFKVWGLLEIEFLFSGLGAVVLKVIWFYKFFVCSEKYKSL